ncbi:hypothetical protein B0H11DRAFT_1927764 [Mycena galericulata]|nr:hypothetical protein B0H11DRAFT_1927764 [Mycena galericulata]
MSDAKRHLRPGVGVSRRIRRQNCLIWNAGVVVLQPVWGRKKKLVQADFLKVAILSGLEKNIEPLLKKRKAQRQHLKGGPPARKEGGQGKHHYYFVTAALHEVTAVLTPATVFNVLLLTGGKFILSAHFREVDLPHLQRRRIELPQIGSYFHAFLRIFEHQQACPASHSLNCEVRRVKVTTLTIHPAAAPRPPWRLADLVPFAAGRHVPPHLVSTMSKIHLDYYSKAPLCGAHDTRQPNLPASCNSELLRTYSGNFSPSQHHRLFSELFGRRQAHGGRSAKTRSLPSPTLMGVAAMQRRCAAAPGFFSELFGCRQARPAFKWIESSSPVDPLIDQALRGAHSAFPRAGELQSLAYFSKYFGRRQAHRAFSGLDRKTQFTDIVEAVTALMRSEAAPITPRRRIAFPRAAYPVYFTFSLFKCL